MSLQQELAALQSEMSASSNAVVKKVLEKEIVRVQKAIEEQARMTVLTGYGRKVRVGDLFYRGYLQGGETPVVYARKVIAIGGGEVRKVAFERSKKGGLVFQRLFNDDGTPVVERKLGFDNPQDAALAIVAYAQEKVAEIRCELIAAERIVDDVTHWAESLDADSITVLEPEQED